MILFFCVALAASVGLYFGKMKKDKRLLYASLTVLLIDIVLFAIGSILYAIYE